MFALNRLAVSSKYLFGRDVVFTYGPLGFLFVPQADASGSTLITAEVFWCCLQVSLFAAAGWRFRRQAMALELFSAGYLTLGGLGMWLDNRLLFAVGAFALMSLEQSGGSVVFAAAAMGLGLTGLLMKWSVGISALSIVAGSWIILICDGGRTARRTLTGSLVCAGLGLVAIIVFLDSPANVWHWMRGSMEVATGYSSAMSIAGALKQLFLAVASGACLLALNFMLSKRARYYLWMFAGFFFFSFKQGFVRQDVHRLAYFIGAAVIPVVLLFAPPLTSREGWKALGTLAALSGIAVVSAHDIRPLHLAGIRDYLLVRPGISNLHNLMTIGRVRKELCAFEVTWLRSSVLPESWQTKLADPESTVSILPWELSIAAANRLNWEPTPVLQLYSAYTARLDRAVADHLNDDGPRYLVVNFSAIDGRNMFLDTPLTWRAVMDDYEVEETDPNTGRVFMLRKASSRREAMREVGSGRAQMNEWVPVPEGTHLLYAPLQIKFTVLGRLVDFLYQTPPLYIETVRRGGRTGRYRLMSATAENGILINYPPSDMGEMANLFSGEADDPVVRFRLVPPPSVWRYQRPYSWRLLESSRTVARAGSPPRQP